MTTHALMELAACPWCKRSNSTSDPHALEVYPCDGDYQVRCGHCVAFGPMSSSEDGAAEAWNKLRTAAAEGGAVPDIDRWTMAKGSDGQRWSVYMDRNDTGEWCKWSEVQQKWHLSKLPAHPPTDSGAGRDGCREIVSRILKDGNFFPFTIEFTEIDAHRLRDEMVAAIAGAAGEPK